VLGDCQKGDFGEAARPPIATGRDFADSGRAGSVLVSTVSDDAHAACRKINLARGLHANAQRPVSALVLTMSISEKTDRLAWVDYAKGICIILVILMHANGGVEKLTGQLTFIDAFIQWAKPFRMPDFFLISGLFLASRINAPWPKYLDTKVLHFAYFYVLWSLIQLVYKDVTLGDSSGIELSRYLTFLYEPASTLWFIYLLMIFFVVTKITLPLPKVLIFVIAAVLEALPIHTGHLVIDEFCSRFVFFFAGNALAPYVFAFASRVAGQKTGVVLGALMVWATVNALCVWNGVAFWPVFSLAFGFAGTAALISTGVLCTRSSFFRAIRYCGENSIVIYLAFTLFMGPARIVLFKLAPGLVPEAVSMLSALAGVAGPLALHWITKGSWFGFLFVRPDWARWRPAHTVAASNSYIQFNPERRLSPR
jgi:uncharacterized membrane protein YcfT